MSPHGMHLLYVRLCTSVSLATESIPHEELIGAALCVAGQRPVIIVLWLLACSRPCNGTAHLKLSTHSCMVITISDLC